jgi:hypothetical protein
MFATALAALLLQPAACTREAAADATIEAIRSAPERWVDRCVAISGIASWRVLYRDGASIYQVGYWPHAHAEAARRLRLGLDDRDVPELRSWRHAFTPVALVGRVDTCERRHERAAAEATRAEQDPGLIALSGYCHHSGGPLVIVSQVTAGPAATRLTLASAPGSYELMPVPARWRERDALGRTAAAFVAALRSGDSGALAGLLGERPSSAQGREAAARTLAAFGACRRRQPAQIAHFVSRFDPDMGLQEGGAFSARTCLCRTGDCSRSWPLSVMDADAAPERPYACFEASRGEWAGARVRVSFSDEAILKEPPRTAMQR